DRNAEFFRQEVTETGAVQNAGHADNLVGGQSGGLLHHHYHHIQRVGDDDDERVRRVFFNAVGHLSDDFGVGVDQIIAAHAGLAGDAGGDDHHIGALDIGVIIGAFEADVEILNGRA